MMNEFEASLPLFSRTEVTGAGIALLSLPSLHDVEMEEMALRTGEDIVERFSKSESSSVMISSVEMCWSIMGLEVPRWLRAGFQHVVNP